MTFFPLFSPPILVPDFDLINHLRKLNFPSFKNELTASGGEFNLLGFQRGLDVWPAKSFVRPPGTDESRKSFPGHPAAIWRKPSGCVWDDPNPALWAVTEFSPILSSLITPN